MSEEFVIPILVVVAALGPVIGSFFGAMIMRSEKLTKSGGERSACDHCGHTLTWYELIPVISYIIQRGKCRHCHKPIDFRIFLADLMGLVFYSILAVGVYKLYVVPGQIVSTSAMVFLGVHFILLTMMFYLSVFDMFTLSIPADWVNYTTVFIVGVNIVFAGLRLWQEGIFADIKLGQIENLVLGVLAALALWLLVKVTKEKGLGMGDVFLAAIIGLGLGWPNTVSAFYVMLFSALGAGLIYAAKLGKLKGLQVPLVPFMTLGFIVSLVWGQQIFNLLFLVI